MDEILQTYFIDKDKGDLAYDAERYIVACEHYDAALEALEKLEKFDDVLSARGVRVKESVFIVRTNRAACRKHRKMFQEAIEDCNFVIFAGGAAPTRCVVKAFYRRARAHEGLGDADAAILDFQRTLQIEPNNEAALKALKKFDCVFHRACVLHNASPEVLARQSKFKNFTSRPKLRHLCGE